MVAKFSSFIISPGTFLHNYFWKGAGISAHPIRRESVTTRTPFGRCLWVYFPVLSLQFVNSSSLTVIKVEDHHYAAEHTTWSICLLPIPKDVPEILFITLQVPDSCRKLWLCQHSFLVTTTVKNCEGSKILSNLQAKNPVTVSWMLSKDS